MTLRNNNYLILFIFSILVAFIKWSISFYFFPESLDTKILHESVGDASYYYPLIKYLSELSFNNSFDPEITNLKTVPLPIWGIFFHAVSLKIFGYLTFILMDIFCVFIILLIFFKIYSFSFASKTSILLSIFIFLIPIIISNTSLVDIQYFWIFGETFYALRVPRPMITNIYFFCFILLVLKMTYEKFHDYKIFFFIGAILGFSLSSFYYHFFTEIIFLFIFLAYKFKISILKELKNNFKFYLVSFFSFLITSLPFILNLVFHENDFTNRQCVFLIDEETKKNILNYFFMKYSSIKGLILIFGISSLTLCANIFNLKDKKIINIFYLLFLSSLLGPILFFLISNKSCVIYHFVNFIILNAILFLIIFSQVVLKRLIYFKINNIFFSIFILIFLSFSTYNEINKNQKNNVDQRVEYKKEFNLITKKIKNFYKINEISLLTFETNFMVWAIMNDVKYLDLIKSIFTPKKDYMIENDIFSAFKKLGLDEGNFELFIENREYGWRYMNPHITKFVYYKYQANSLMTYKKSKDFEDDELKIINNTHLLLQQQQIIPRFELQRLKDDFRNFNKELIYPELIILNKKDDFFNLNDLNIEKYCSVYSGNIFEMFLRKDLKLCSN